MRHLQPFRNEGSEQIAQQVFARRVAGGSGSDLGFTLDTDGTLAANSDDRVATQKATKTYVDAAVLGAGGATAGMQIQYVRVTSTTTYSSSGATTTIPLDGTKPQNTEGTHISDLDLTITPNSGSNIIRAEWDLPVISANGAATFIWVVFKDSGADAVNAGTFELSGGDWSGGVKPFYSEVAGSTSARTYKLFIGNPSGARTVYVSRLSSVSNLFGGSIMAEGVVKEIKT